MSPAVELGPLAEAASTLARRGKGTVITFSKKAFFPLTNLCRDYCRYCTFRRDPGEEGAHTMTPDEVLEVAGRAARMGCKEALFSLGDKPELAFPEAREQLRRLGYGSTIEYLAAICRLVATETPLLPHSNPGLMSRSDMELLRPWNVSMGAMLECSSPRLSLAGGPHDRAPDKEPGPRRTSIREAGRLNIAFTSGILIGIGETPADRVDSLFDLREIHQEHGHLQEIIVQNFRAKPRTAMRKHREPGLDDLVRTTAVARLIFGPAMNIQVPPNLSPGTYGSLLGAGINDWGGISPLTMDYINPEAPWPLIRELGEVTAGRGLVLRERLAIYPEFIRPEFVPATLRTQAEAWSQRIALEYGSFS
ncbi:MAG: 7,8-didemethyl-8-hydroxy-5-deazariboflavin synthase CofG [Acidobacteria bacterium]|nr:7,8-didemethyl-8-hydroxy-5-deazariboflavin synthase CofG [Acidobacteriota bacterium]